MTTSEPCDGCTLGTCPLWSSCPVDLAADALDARRLHLTELEERLRDEDVEAGRRPFGTGLGEERLWWSLDLRSDVEQQRHRTAQARELRDRVERASGRFIVPLWHDLEVEDEGEHREVLDSD